MKDVQVPVCPLCNKPIPVRRGEPPDIKMSEHIDSDCQSDPAKEKRRVFANKCSLKGCKQKELVPVMCSSCHQNYCLRHRHTTDHDCKGYQNSGQAVSRQAAAAIKRASTSATTGRKPQETTLTSVGRNLDRERQERFATRQQSPMKDQHVQSTQRLEAGMSEDEAMARAIQMSLVEQQPWDQTSQQKHQVDADMALAQALQESEVEEQQRQSQQVPRERRQQSSDESKCHIV